MYNKMRATQNTLGVQECVDEDPPGPGDSLKIADALHRLVTVDPAHHIPTGIQLFLTNHLPNLFQLTLKLYQHLEELLSMHSL